MSCCLAKLKKQHSVRSVNFYVAIYFLTLVNCIVCQLWAKVGLDDWLVLCSDTNCVLVGHDVIAQAQSGTGKTATFSIAILEQINVAVLKCQALVLAPTRELAQQVFTVDE